MRTVSAGVRRTCLVALVLGSTLTLVSCVPTGDGGTTTTTPPAPTALISPTSGPPGTFVDVAPPGGDCLNPSYAYTSLQASMTIASSGIVVTTGYQYIGSNPLSGYTSADPFVRLRVPPGLATGSYLVYLSCYNYLDSYEYSPATFTVTAA